MRFFRNLESFFEHHIEGYFNKKFPGALQPVELAKILVKEMEANLFVGISKVYAPNSYTVSVHAKDYDKFAPYKQAICDELSAYLHNEAHRKEYTMLGSASVLIISSDKKLDKILVSSEFTEPIPKESSTPDCNVSLQCEMESDTRIFDKPIDKVNPPQPQIMAVLTVIVGVDKGKRQTISNNRINIGRREKNELALSDMNTSRLHAYIVLDGMVHIVHDAKSLNGTYVNHQRITKKALATGDKISLGNTEILYEVK